MNCLVTAGPTWEPVDEVRRLTNLSTGRLGTELANFLVDRGHRVTLLIGTGATYGGACRADSIVPFTTGADLRRQLEAQASEGVQAVFHAAAVGDFLVAKVWRRTAAGKFEALTAAKLSSRIEQVWLELKPAPKIILQLIHWFPRAWRVGWKYEVDGGRDQIIAAGRSQLVRCGTHACVINGPAYGEGYGVVAADGGCRHCENATTLFERLAEGMRDFRLRDPAGVTRGKRS